MSHVINSRALTGEKLCINKAIHDARVCDFQYDCTGATDFAAITRCVLPGPRTCIVCGNFVRETSVKRRNNKIVQEITQNVANVFSFYALIVIKHGFSMY